MYDIHLNVIHIDSHKIMSSLLNENYQENSEKSCQAGISKTPQKHHMVYSRGEALPYDLDESDSILKNFIPLDCPSL